MHYIELSISRIKGLKWIVDKAEEVPQIRDAE